MKEEQYLIILSDEALMKKTKKQLIEYIRSLEKDLCGEQEVEEYLEELKGIELTENDKKQVKWLKEEYMILQNASDEVEETLLEILEGVNKDED